MVAQQAAASKLCIMQEEGSMKALPWEAKLACKVEALLEELGEKENAFSDAAFESKEEIEDELREAADHLLQAACWLQAIKLGHYMEEEEELDFRQQIEEEE